MAKTYQIELKIDDSQAQAANERQLQGMTRTERAALRAAEQQERQAQKAAAARERFEQRAAEMAERQAQKAADARQRADQRAADVAARQAQKAADSRSRADQRVAEMKDRADQRAAETQARRAQRAAEAQERADQRAADAKARITQKAADAQVAAAQKAQTRIDALKGRAFTDEEVRNRAIGAIQDRLNDRRVSAATKAAAAERASGLPLLERLKEQSGLLDGKINPGMIAFGAATAVAGLALQDQVQHWRDIAQGIQDSIKFTKQYREGLAENAATAGRLGNTTQEARQELLLRNQTLQTAQEARDFREGQMNVGQVSIGTRISQADFDRLQVEGGAYQAVEGGAARTHGELVGSLPSLIKLRRDAAGREIPATADEVFAEEAKISEIMRLGKTSFTSGVDQLLKNQALTQSGAYGSISEQAAVQSMYSLVSKEQAGEYTAWLNRATVGNLQDKELSPYLQGLGVGDQKRALPIADAVSRDLAKQEGAAKAAGKEFSGYDYLNRVGFKNQEDIKALTAYHAQSQNGQLRPFLDLARAPADAAKLRAEIAGAGADPRMQDRSVEISGELQKFTYDRAYGSADAYRRQVFLEAKQRNPRLGDKYEDVAQDPTFKKQRLLQDSVNETLQRSAKRAGIKLDDLPGYKPHWSQLDLDQPVQKALDQLNAARANPFAESRAFLTFDAKENLDRAEKAEGPARAGLAALDKDRRARWDAFNNAQAQPALAAERRIPDMLAAPARAVGQGLAAVRGQFGGLNSLEPFPQGRGALASSGPVDNSLQGLLQELITLTKEANKTRAAQAQPAPPEPLPLSGQGRNWRDRP